MKKQDLIKKDDGRILDIIHIRGGYYAKTLNTYPYGKTPITKQEFQDLKASGKFRTINTNVPNTIEYLVSR